MKYSSAEISEIGIQWNAAAEWIEIQFLLDEHIAFYAFWLY